MVACVDCIELPLAWVLQEVPSLLEEIRINCQAARTSAEVGNIMAAAQDTLRQRLANSTPFSVEAPDAQSVRARLLSRREWGPNQEGLHRILHQMHGQFMAFGLGQHQSFSETVFLRKTPHGGTAPLSQQIRVPQAADTPAASLRQWIDFFLHKLNPATPILLVNCLDQKWMDITIGEPSSREFFSIKASRAALPLANDVPYKMDEASQEFARDFIASYRMTTNGKTKPNRNTTYLLLGLLLLLVLAALFLAYLQHASPGNIPEFLRGAARSLGNPRVAPSEK
jgi:hypothetical protein